MAEASSDDDDLVDIPPAAERVAARALVLRAVVCRGVIEGDAGNSKAEEFRSEVLNWIRNIGAAEEAESSELAVLECKLGGLTDRQRIDSTWRAEGLVVLAWALGRCDLPAYDKKADPYPIALALGFREQRPAAELVLAPQLRSSDEISALADTLFSLHWRLRQYSLDKKPMDFGEFAKTAYFGPLPLDGLRLISQDIDVRGVPIWDASEKDWREVLSITRERQQAANWLTGQERIYSQVTCDT